MKKKADLGKLINELKNELDIRKDNRNKILDKGILIIDDDENLIRSLEFIFRDQYRVFTCLNGPDAVPLYKKNKSSIFTVLLDIKMEGKDGIQVYKEIKKINSKMVTRFVDYTFFSCIDFLRLKTNAIN